MNIYGHGDASLGDSRSHMGIAVFEHGSPIVKSPHPQSKRYRPLEDLILRGRCELISFSQDQKDRAIQLLSAFAYYQSNIPEFGVGDCHDWVAAAVSMLERARFVSGHWQDGMWISGQGVVCEGKPDEKFPYWRDLERPFGKLDQNPEFQEWMKSLVDVRYEEKKDRVYVSSPLAVRVVGID
ncbi:hypothetical protein PHISCL_00043 [Aspergillus sclerotialis]|uniref:Uncharacterized protein n=1 Tax=Aspergillus sclerotialis TaxID=2070753 RepID=A0A3A2ZWT4_9EURO|nr:hypothetical protein PHISCL_00043 [Aspergillus sclerotialis]